MTQQLSMSINCEKHLKNLLLSKDCIVGIGINEINFQMY